MAEAMMAATNVRTARLTANISYVRMLKHASPTGIYLDDNVTRNSTNRENSIVTPTSIFSTFDRRQFFPVDRLHRISINF